MNELINELKVPKQTYGFDIVLKSVQEVATFDHQLLHGLGVDLDLAGGLDQPVHGGGLRRAHQTLQLGTGEVFGEGR